MSDRRRQRKFCLYGTKCYEIFKPGSRGHRPRTAVFLKLLLFARWYVCVCVSTPRALITIGMTWCDIDCVRLVKQVSWLFPAFNYFI